MAGRYLTDLADVCRAAGLTVLEQDGWKTRARKSGGYGPGQPDHIMVHHTASGPNANGWADCNYMSLTSSIKPITNLYIDRAGIVYVLAAGCTNTNGVGIDPCHTMANDSMNTHAIGIEGGNDGIGEVWPEIQQTSYVILVAALCTAYNINPACVHGHYEYAPARKVDPAGPSRWSPDSMGGGRGNQWIMTDFRTDVDDLISPAPVPMPPSPPFTGTALTGDPMFCTHSGTGEFWIVAVDWMGQWAAPIREIPQIQWHLIGPVNDTLNGPLKPVDGNVLQAIYDVRGRPATP